MENSFHSTVITLSNHKLIQNYHDVFDPTCLFHRNIS